jgi:short-subunit dehydrogenase
MRYRGTTALITGASSGLGEEFARQLAGRGADLILVARRKDVLDQLAEDLHRVTGRQVDVVAADLSAPGAAAGLVQTLTRQGLSVDTLVNNAGFGKTGLFSESSTRDLHEQLSLNIDAVVDLTQALLPQLLRSGHGALVNVASLTAYMPIPAMAVYAASKAFVLRFTQALSYELRDSGLSVLALSPGPTRTGFYAASGTAETGVRFQSPAQVVATALRALDRPRTPVSVVSGWRNRWTSRVLTVLPGRTVLRMAAG